jgi:hypothetical protein
MPMFESSVAITTSQQPRIAALPAKQYPAAIPTSGTRPDSRANHSERQAVEPADAGRVGVAGAAAPALGEEHHREPQLLGQLEQPVLLAVVLGALRAGEHGVVVRDGHALGRPAANSSPLTDPMPPTDRRPGCSRRGRRARVGDVGPRSPAARTRRTCRGRRGRRRSPGRCGGRAPAAARPLPVAARRGRPRGVRSPRAGRHAARPTGPAGDVPVPSAVIAPSPPRLGDADRARTGRHDGVTVVPHRQNRSPPAAGAGHLVVQLHRLDECQHRAGSNRCADGHHEQPRSCPGARRTRRSLRSSTSHRSSPSCRFTRRRASVGTRDRLLTHHQLGRHRGEQRRHDEVRAGRWSRRRT